MAPSPLHAPITLPPSASVTGGTYLLDSKENPKEQNFHSLSVVSSNVGLVDILDDTSINYTYFALNTVGLRFWMLPLLASMLLKYGVLIYWI